LVKRIVSTGSNPDGCGSFPVGFSSSGRQNPVPLRGDREAEPQDLIHDRIGTQQKLPLRAAAGDEVRRAGNDLPWCGHERLQMSSGAPEEFWRSALAATGPRSGAFTRLGSVIVCDDSRGGTAALEKPVTRTVRPTAGRFPKSCFRANGPRTTDRDSRRTSSHGRALRQVGYPSELPS